MLGKCVAVVLVCTVLMWAICKRIEHSQFLANKAVVNKEAQWLSRNIPECVEDGDTIETEHLDYFGQPMEATFNIDTKYVEVIVVSRHRRFDDFRDDIQAACRNYHIGKSIEEAGRRTSKGLSEGIIEGVADGVRSVIQKKENKP